MIRTLRDRKRDEARRRTEAVAVLSERLRRHAREAGGRYLLYGSAGRGAMRFDSDVDLLVDFPAEAEAAAWRFAEAACAAEGIAADIRPIAWCTEPFRAQILPEARILA
ncbi:nucleotidyltransferase domain-containing protein [Methylobacterium dankookense]|uniref:Polymerase nucleotidyl transferase domain-containing protein n=1 Tax=Methylobacterium dankookense TaxID=560405 RepID=A0A564FXA7_9HYPH|nr:nucleotidyltransferase domain-containing protein [Methylobacterium dankookense]GJD57710.1 hypothetical protein IFDJLNFL_3622 [Methylobacterium dankookense]VUF12340.1 hypothetical protein MTDSW087_02030 [Methylobacterium dankookense]